MRGRDDATLATMRLRSRTIAALIVTAVLLGACGGGGDEEATTTTSEAPTTTAAVTTTAPVGPVSMLTGLASTDPATLTRPVVAVKIDNVDGKSTPQIGINQADVVYEFQVEGQVTRLLSLFQSTDAAPVGPVRSARGSEVAMLDELNHPLFTWHGANDVLLQAVRNSTVIPRSIDDIPGVFYRASDRPAPYNSFIKGTSDVRATAPAGSAGPTVPIFAFAKPGEAASPLAVPASRVDIRFPPPFGRGGGEAPVTYEWDQGKWQRTQKGRPHVDADGNRVAIENVIVRFTEAVDSGTVDKAGTRVPTAKVIGTGEVWVFSNGTVTTGTWNKADNVSPTKYLDAQGNEIKLTPGRTWVSFPYGNVGSAFG